MDAGIGHHDVEPAELGHSGSVRVVDIRTMSGVGVGSEGTGAKELGWWVSDGADSWSAKFDRTGRFVFVNDRNAGLQVYRVGGPGARLR